jgi:hypothetical protein
MTAPTTTSPLLDRMTDRQPEPPQPFVAPWRRRQLEQIAERERRGLSRFDAVADRTGIVVL